MEQPQTEAISFQMPDGMRGFTIPVSKTESPAGVLVPGDFVDVLVAGATTTVITPPSVLIGFRPAETETSQSVVTLLQNVQVLSVQREYVDNGVPYDASVRGGLPEADNVSYVTIAITPAPAQVMWLATQDGRVTLALRSFGDDAIADLGPISGPLGPQN